MTDPRIERLTEMVAALREEGYNRQESIELLYARIEALEAARQPQQDKLDRLIAEDRLAEAAQQPQQLDQSLAPPIGVKPQWLVDEERLGDLEVAIKRREDRGVPVLLDWVIEVCEIRDRQKKRRKGRGLREKVDLIVQVEEKYGQQPDHIADASKMVDTGWRNLHDLSPIMEPAPPAPADVVMSEASRSSMEVRDYLDSIKVYGSTSTAPPAPAGGLVELIRDELGHHGTASASAVIRKVATWLRSELISRAAADRLDQEANR